MREREATPTQMASPQQSEFSEFLYAPIGEEQNGMILTTLSALARMGVDPWREAAGLALLPAEAATRRMTSIISTLPNGHWAKSDARTIAARLISLLPAAKAPQAPPRGTAFGERPVAYRVAVFAFFLLLNTAVFFALRSHEPPPAIDNGPAATSTTNAAPKAPLADTE